MFILLLYDQSGSGLLVWVGEKIYLKATIVESKSALLVTTT